MNKVILMGRLTSDPKMDWTRSEDSKQYATYTLAVNRRFKKNGQADTDFISCIAWGAMAEFAEKFMKKGEIIMKRLALLLGSLLVVTAAASAKEVVPAPVVVEEAPVQIVEKEVIVYRDKEEGFRPNGYVDLQYRYYGDTEGNGTNYSSKPADNRADGWNTNNTY